MHEADAVTMGSDESENIGTADAEMSGVEADLDAGVVEEPANVGQLMDNSRIREELGFEPRYTIESGLADYLERIRSAPDVTGR